MLLKLSDMPKDGIKLCKVLTADKIKKRSSFIDGLPGSNGQIIKTESSNHVSEQPSEALVNACWRMIKTCLQEDGIGLAAPQIGIMKRMFIIREQQIPEPTFKVYFHPSYSIDVNSKTEIAPEGCLSVPGKTLFVPRATIICASWYEFDSEKKLISRTELFEGFKARVFQHEYDHIIGISILDKAVKHH